jgi:plastocyanin
MKTPTAFAIVAALSCVGAMTVSAETKPVEGKVTGHVKFDGKMPELKPLAITEEKSKGCCPAGSKMDTSDPSMVVSKDGGLANAVVLIEVPGEKMEPSTETVEIDQKLCHFEPHVKVVPAGGKVIFLNSDQVSHNIHTYANKNDSFNKTVAPGSKEECTLAKGDKVQVKCDIHDWMSAWVYVAETPHFAITKEDGSFEIGGLKPGKYKVEVWHEKLGKAKGEATVKEDGTCDALDIKMGDKKK